jgi:hypothetical protein
MSEEKKCTDSKCENEEWYPQYGVAPHECYWKKPGGFEENMPGDSTIEPLEKWPDSFLAEIDGSKPIKPQLQYGLCGVYFCPKCKAGLESSLKSDLAQLMSKEQILEAIKDEPDPI